MSKLEAVNIMLSAIGESPVTDISTTTNVDVVRAVAKLDEVTRDEQLKQYSFNVDKVTLTPDASTHVVTLPTTATGLAQLLTDCPGQYILTYGNKLATPSDYPTATAFTQATVVVSVIVPRDFANLPEHAKQYIAYAAAFAFVDDSLTDQGRTQAWSQKLFVARNRFNKQENRTIRPSFLYR
jgi:hypothetical protein